MTLYDDVCTPCARKQKWRELKRFAAKNRLPLTRIDISKQPEYREEAEKYGVEIPFVVNGAIALSLNEPLEGLL